MYVFLSSELTYIFQSIFLLWNNFRFAEKLQKNKYKEFLYTFHPDSSDVNILPH